MGSSFLSVFVNEHKPSAPNLRQILGTLALDPKISCSMLQKTQAVINAMTACAYH
jgi:hypothetical protein